MSAYPYVLTICNEDGSGSIFWGQFHTIQEAYEEAFDSAEQFQYLKLANRNTGAIIWAVRDGKITEGFWSVQN